jgi:hypothetical protein
LVVQDHVSPDDEQAARYIDSFERLRDPSHFKAFAEYEWRGMLLDAGLHVQDVEIINKGHSNLRDWALRQNCTEKQIERLQVMLHQAPAPVREFLQPRYTTTEDAEFLHHFILISGDKPTA